SSITLIYFIMIYRMTFKKGFYHYWPIFIFLVGAFLFVVFMVVRFGIEDLNQFILIASVLCLVFIVPTIYLHIQYYIYTLNDKLEINHDNFSYEHKGGKNGEIDHLISV